MAGVLANTLGGTLGGEQWVNPARLPMATEQGSRVPLPSPFSDARQGRRAEGWGWMWGLEGLFILSLEVTFSVSGALSPLAQMGALKGRPSSHLPSPLDPEWEHHSGFEELEPETHGGQTIPFLIFKIH